MAEVDVGVAAGQSTKVFQEGRGVFQVVVDPKDPPGVELGDESEILLDALEVLALLSQLRVGISVEREAKNLVK